MKSGKQLDSYVPERGDIIYIDFNPIKGHEQGNKTNNPRPALVISPMKYNKLSSLALVCPITSKIKNLNFEVHLNEQTETQGVILSDQVRCLDWKARKARFYKKAPSEIVDEVLAKIETLIL
ncbi:MAG TPA: mRNA-degrading endonuclease [Cyanobacteria bacterium UBA11162]|nr:mRNA-degrading endonuclease [Cyanobacteria bacterium UBA11162]